MQNSVAPIHAQADGDPLWPLLQATRRSNDTQAFREIYDRTRQRLFALAIKMLGNSADAEDVLADVFLQAWRQRGEYDGARGSVMTWLTVICRSRCLDLRRRRRNVFEDIDSIAPETWSEQALVVEHAATHLDGDRAKGLATALTSLSFTQRQMIALAFYRGLTHEEIAAATQTPLGTVKSHIRRALSALKAGLENPPASFGNR